MHSSAKRHFVDFFFGQYLKDKEQGCINNKGHKKGYSKAYDYTSAQEYHCFVDDQTKSAHNKGSDSRKDKGCLYFLFVAKCSANGEPVKDTYYKGECNIADYKTDYAKI